MQKIISLFKRDYEGTRLVYDEVVSGAEWVINGEGAATEKIDGTACMVQDGRLYKRYDRKLTRAKFRKLKRNKSYIPKREDYKTAPEGWLAAEPAPDQHTGHWPGWVPVGDSPEDQYHQEAWIYTYGGLADGTYELIGPKVEGNPYRNTSHRLIRHGAHVIDPEPPRTFEALKAWFETNYVEGIVWHHPDGRMVKIKRKDFGLPWPPMES